MCGIISQQKYREGKYGLTIIDEYTKDGEVNALLVNTATSAEGFVSAILSVDGSSYKNFYGYDRSTDEWMTTEAQIERGRQWFADNGYVPSVTSHSTGDGLVTGEGASESLKTEKPKRAKRHQPGIAELSQVPLPLVAEITYDQQPVDQPSTTDAPETLGAERERVTYDGQASDGQLRVQGRTMEEWFQIGMSNDFRETHIHPDMPTDREPSKAEREAYINSLSLMESMMALADMEKADATSVLA